MIDRALVDEIVARTDMEGLVGSYVTLKRAGANFSGLCPFHSEKTPSFTVFPSDGSFYCFGCGVGGNAITFVRRIENLDFTEAVSHLARRAGIRIPETSLKDAGPKYDKDRFYVVGVIKNKGVAKYVCYGVPDTNDKNPPQELQGYCSFVKTSKNQHDSHGYWIMFQDAQNGKCIKSIN